MGEGNWNLEVIRIVQTFTLLQYWRAKRARINYNNKIKKNNLWTPSPTHKSSTQDPASDKSQEGGGGCPDPRPPLWIRACMRRVKGTPVACAYPKPVK